MIALKFSRRGKSNSRNPFSYFAGKRVSALANRSLLLPIKNLVQLDASTQIHCFARGEDAGCIKHNRFPMMVHAFVMTVETVGVENLAAFRPIRGRDFVLREDGMEWAFVHARTTVNTGVGINVKRWPPIGWRTRLDTIHRANGLAAIISQAQAGNYVGHD
jgi:hypothetical protein